MAQEHNITQEQLDDAVLTITGHPDWSIIVKGLENDIYHTQASMADASSWDQVNELRGFMKGLAFVINLRNTIKAVKEQEEINAAL